MKLSKITITILLTLIACVFLCACNSTRHVPAGNYLLDSVYISLNDSSKQLDVQELSTYLRQQPNHKMLWSMKFRLGVFNLSGSDSTKWYNKWIRKIGEAPVVFDNELTEAGRQQLIKALENKGYLDAMVETDTIVDDRKRKIKVKYEIISGKPHIIKSLDFVCDDPELRNAVLTDSAKFPVKPGERLDRQILSQQRDAITSALRNRGYYDFAKESITFNADTTEGSRLVDLTMTITKAFNPSAKVFSNHEKYAIARIYVITDYDTSSEENLREISAADTVYYKDLTILYGENKYLRPGILYENVFLRAGRKFSQEDVDKTYRAFSRLGILKFINLRFVNAGKLGDSGLLDCYVLLTPGKAQSVSVEIEGTNSEGDLGVAVGLSYTHRNIGRGSETLSAKVRGAYESLSGNLEGLLHDRYMEYSVDMGINFPKFKAPFLSERFKRRINAVTELNVALAYQERPEYTRIISNAGWSYKWTYNKNQNRYVFTPLDINYVYLPESTYDFIDQIAPDNPLLRYSYEDHFIMRMGFSFYHSNKKNSTTRFQRDIYTVRANLETAGNLLYAFSNAFDRRANHREDPYSIFGIHYSQYVKINSDFTLIHAFDPRNSLALHAGLGVGVPYGNSTILPFEKRFYGGGANGVRGWDVRTLGPGRFPGTNSVSDFINQCGDIRFDVSTEYRAKLFWVFELGAFIDAGNIWTIKEYPNQPGGVFRFKSFYKEIAASYGLGFRMDFNYFLLRFDVGMKAHNPAMNQKPWPLISPNWHRDSSFHFSIGYPF